MLQEHLLAIPVFNEERYVDRVLSVAKRFSRNNRAKEPGLR